MTLPNFLCIGAQKSGTTLLYEILKLHPEIFLPEQKELHFFDNDHFFSKGVDWYQHNFQKATHYKRIGEITPAYIFFEPVPKRIRDALGDNLKFVLILRNPVDRAYSNYWMEYNRGAETLSFEKAIIMEHARIRQDYAQKASHSYISRGFYYEQIKRYLDYFPLENMKILIFEELIVNIPRFINELLNFLNCDTQFQIPEFKKVRPVEIDPQKYQECVWLNHKWIEKNFFRPKNMDYPLLKNKYRQFLLHLYEDDIHQLQTLLKKDLKIWMKEG